VRVTTHHNKYQQYNKASILSTQFSIYTCYTLTLIVFLQRVQICWVSFSTYYLRLVIVVLPSSYESKARDLMAALPCDAVKAPCIHSDRWRSVSEGVTDSTGEGKSSKSREERDASSCNWVHFVTDEWVLNRISMKWCNWFLYLIPIGDGQFVEVYK
jgi:hypothetical protein